LIIIDQVVPNILRFGQKDWRVSGLRKKRSYLVLVLMI